MHNRGRARGSGRRRPQPQLQYPTAQPAYPVTYAASQVAQQYAYMQSNMAYPGAGYQAYPLSMQYADGSPGAVAALALSSFSHVNQTQAPYFNVGFAQTNALGYTLSSTYVPSSEPAPAVTLQHVPRTQAPRRPTALHKCTYKDCPYSGNAQELKLHMVDRHLVRTEEPESPAKKRKREEEPAVPIPGTGILLDTPEAIEAWIAERKSRWPSARRIEEKARAKEDANNRGEILDGGRGKRGRGRGTMSGRGADRSSVRARRGSSGVRHGNGASFHSQCGSNGRGRPVDSGWPRHQARVEGSPITSQEERPSDVGITGYSLSRSLTPFSDPPCVSGEAYSDSGSDMDPVTDAISSRTPFPEVAPLPSTEVTPPTAHVRHLQPVRIFRARPNHALLSDQAPRDLMRALLAPEIRATVSRLSQAIRFLVDNDFLEGVEETVGGSEITPPVVALQDADGPLGSVDRDG